MCTPSDKKRKYQNHYCIKKIRRLELELGIVEGAKESTIKEALMLTFKHITYAMNFRQSLHGDPSHILDGVYNYLAEDDLDG